MPSGPPPALVYKILKRTARATRTTRPPTTRWRSTTAAGPATARCSTGSVTRGQPATFPLDWRHQGHGTEGRTLIAVGDKARFWIPGALAYGEKPSQPGSPAGTLVFDVELLSIR